MKISALEKERNQQVKQSERELAAQIRGVQDRYKLLAVLLPPIPPILLGVLRLLPPPQGGAGRRRHAAPAVWPRAGRSRSVIARIEDMTIKIHHRGHREHRDG